VRGSKENNLKWRIAVHEGHPGRKASLVVQGMDMGDEAAEKERVQSYVLSIFR
jgi:hypothetical protein